ncbi:hypothetical protein [Aestuariispira insulae]|uniref:hypothetical protein n=1 Tax=Aestuariispira insulae TaxID=1461337 RepID=UPI0011C05165|nr:hypothetical protein [Aestuariispira insulae]
MIMDGGRPPSIKIFFALHHRIFPAVIVRVDLNHKTTARLAPVRPFKREIRLPPIMIGPSQLDFRFLTGLKPLSRRFFVFHDHPFVPQARLLPSAIVTRNCLSPRVKCSPNLKPWRTESAQANRNRPGNRQHKIGILLIHTLPIGFCPRFGPAQQKQLKNDPPYDTKRDSKKMTLSIGALPDVWLGGDFRQPGKAAR